MNLLDLWQFVLAILICILIVVAVRLLAVLAGIDWGEEAQTFAILLAAFVAFEWLDAWSRSKR